MYTLFNDFLGTYLKTYFFNGQKNVQGESGSVIQDYESVDLDPKEIVTDPQHCMAVSTVKPACRYWSHDCQYFRPLLPVHASALAKLI